MPKIRWVFPLDEADRGTEETLSARQAAFEVEEGRAMYCIGHEPAPAHAMIKEP